MNGNLPAEFDAHEYIVRTAEQWRQEVDGLLSHLYMHRVFYYPACLFDWRPLRWFNSICDVFIYCDWMNRPETVRQKLEQIDIPGFDEVTLEYPPPIVSEGIQRFTNMDNLPWDIADRAEDNRAAWGELVKLRNANGQENEDLWLVYFSGHPVTAYQSLFTAKKTAPRLVCLRHSTSFPAENWRNFVSAEGPLLTAIGANPERPWYVLSDVSEPPTI
jgi:hypothetical protein